MLYRLIQFSFVIAISLLALLPCQNNALAQSEYSTIVRIEVLAEPEIEKSAYDIILEELSALDDVRVRGRGEIFGFKVMITAIRPPRLQSKVWGYAATLIVERYPGLAFIDQVNAALADHKEGRAYQKLAEQVMERGVVNYATMKVVTRDALPDICRELVAVFDKQVLEPDRKRFAELIALEKELLAKKQEEDRLRAEAEAKAAEQRKIQEEERKAAELAEAKKSKTHKSKSAAGSKHADKSKNAEAQHDDGHSETQDEQHEDEHSEEVDPEADSSSIDGESDDESEPLEEEHGAESHASEH